MNISYDTAEELFNRGDFDEIRRTADLSHVNLRQISGAHRLLIAHALALLGEAQLAVHVTRFVDETSSSPLIRSKLHFIYGLTNESAGATADALAHFQAALRFATAAGDYPQIAWSYVRILRHLIERGDRDAAMAVLQEARRAAIRAGTAHVIVFLHQCVSALEGHLGRLDEALRHLDLADSLLQLAPNAWLKAGSLVNRGVIAMLACEYDSATRYLLEAKTGARPGIVENNLAHAYIFTGQFRKAADTLERLLRSDKTHRSLIRYTLDGMARLRLAQREFVQCRDVLRTISEQAQSDLAFANSYPVRWAAVTEARLLINTGEAAAALALIKSAETRFASCADTPLEAALNLTAVQALSNCGNYAEAAKRVLAANLCGITSMRDLQAPYYFGCASAQRNGSTEVAMQLRHRAYAIWKSQQVVSVPLEMGMSTDFQPAQPPGVPKSAAAAIESIASAFDLAHSPALFGAELINVIRATHCAREVEIVNTPASLQGTLGVSANAVLITLGNDAERRLALSADIPTEPENAVVLAAISRLAGAAVAIESARKHERHRAALWPAEPIEHSAAGLFVSEEMQTLLATARRVATTNVPVLITGETGTGKEVLARAIHAFSNRAKAAFLPFNCTSTPRDMLDSQLFGHRRGSFTGAIDNFQGIIRGAANGTLFLDEIGDMSLEVQPKLLRFLESNEVHPIGETQPVRVDVRVIAATNANLDTLVSEGRFREDLFYRLNIVHLPIPPLRERRIEIPALANHYLEKYALEYGKGNLRLAEETMEYLVLYRWPGNVRQLANEMRRMAALCEAGAVVMPEHLSTPIAASRRTVPASERILDPTEVVVRLDQPMAAATEHLERALLQYALKQCGGRMEETAAMLGLSRKGLYLKRQRFGIEPPESATVSV
jgi:DNA-binding NtrC family response regulator